jgi:hypothetical protein
LRRGNGTGQGKNQNKAKKMLPGSTAPYLEGFLFDHLSLL